MEKKKNLDIGAAPGKTVPVQESSFLSQCAVFLTNVPLLFLAVLWNDLHYLPHALVPVVGLGIAQKFFRPKTLVSDASQEAFSKSQSSVRILIANNVFQAIIVALNHFDNKPMDICSKRDFVFSPWSTACLAGQTFAVIVWCCAMAQLKGCFTNHLEVLSKHKLVTTGVYSTLRHPGYSAATALMFFTALALTRNYGAAIGLGGAMAFWSYGPRIRDEEKMMMETFKQEYEDYKRETGDLLPFLNLVSTPITFK